MTQLITEILDSVTKMIKALEREGASLVEMMAQYAEKAAVTLEQVLRDAFESVKRTLASIARSFKAKLKALEDRRRVQPSSGSTFISKLKTAAHTASNEVEIILEKFTAATEAIGKRAKEVIIKLSTVVEKTTVDAGKFTADAIKELYQSVKTISEKGIKEAKALVKDVDANHTMNGSFEHTHDLEMASVASLVLFDPVLIGSFLVGVSIIAASNSYEM